MSENVIQVNGVSKSFNGRKVLNNISLSVKRGEVFGLLGHNGAGKSTTIDLILGLKEPDMGETTILGYKASRNRKQVFEKVGVQLQQTHYQSGITVEEAEALCDRLFILKSGEKVITGTVDEVIVNSGKKNLEEAYLFYMDEEELL